MTLSQINSERLESLSGLPLSQNIPVTSLHGNRKDSGVLHILQSENIPTVYIETQSNSMDAIDADKKHKEQALVRIINEDGSVEFVGTATLSGSGNSTWEAAKKPYKLKFADSVALFDIANAKEWRLLANYADDSSLRNSVCYSAANDIGIDYTTELKYVNLFLNGSYNGMYNIGTKDKYKDNRGDLLAVFEMSDLDRDYDFKTTHNTCIKISYGDESLIREKVASFDSLLYNAGSYEQIAECIDLPSFAKKYLFEEVIANYDNRLSQIFAVNKDGKIQAIDAWDYDLSLGITWDFYVDCAYNASVIRNSWYQKLWTFPEFRQLVWSTYAEHEPVLSDDGISKMLQTSDCIAHDWKLNNIRWQNHEAFYEGRTKLNNSSPPTDLAEHTHYIEEYISKRHEFLRAYLESPDDYCTISFINEQIAEVRLLYPKGTTLNVDMLPSGIFTISQNWHTADGKSVDGVLLAENLIFYS